MFLDGLCRNQCACLACALSLDNRVISLQDFSTYSQLAVSRRALLQIAYGTHHWEKKTLGIFRQSIAELDRRFHEHYSSYN